MNDHKKPAFKMSDTYPYRSIAEHFDLPYDVVLCLSERTIWGERAAKRVAAALSVVEYTALVQAIAKVLRSRYRPPEGKAHTKMGHPAATARRPNEGLVG